MYRTVKLLLYINLIIDCGSLDHPEHGTVTHSSNATSFEVEATYSCGLGYNLVGDTRRICQADGNWSNTEPECQIKG